VEEYAGGNPPEDDVTVLLLRPNAFKPRGSLAGGIKAGFRMGGRLVRSLLPGGDPFPSPQRTAANFLGAFFDGWNRRGER